MKKSSGNKGPERQSFPKIYIKIIEVEAEGFIWTAGPVADLTKVHPLYYCSVIEPATSVRGGVRARPYVGYR